MATAVRAKGGSGHGDFESETFVTGCLNANGKAAGSATQQDAESGMLVTHAIRADDFDASEDGTGRGTPLIPIDMRQASRGDKITNNRTHGSGGAPGHGVGEPGDPAFTVSERGQAIAFDPTQITSKTNRSQPTNGAPCHTLAKGATAPAIAFTSKDHGADASDIAPTLRSMGHDNSHANGGGQVAVAFQGKSSAANSMNPTDIAPSLDRAKAGGMSTLAASGVRRLTPRECERLQGLPDDFTRIPVRALKHKPKTKHFAKYPDLYEENADGTWTRYCADGPRYKALGNSMAVPVVRWVGDRLRIAAST